jgi:hypothetical protein
MKTPRRHSRAPKGPRVEYSPPNDVVEMYLDQVIAMRGRPALTAPRNGELFEARQKIDRRAKSVLLYMAGDLGGCDPFAWPSSAPGRCQRKARGEHASSRPCWCRHKSPSCPGWRWASIRRRTPPRSPLEAELSPSSGLRWTAATRNATLRCRRKSTGSIY